MILALSRFRVANGMEAQVRAAFVGRPRRVENVAGFCGLDVYTNTVDPCAFLLLTRWSDEASFRRWHGSPEHHASHSLMPRGMKLDPRGTELIVAERVDGATSGGTDGDLLADFALPLARLLDEGTTAHLLEVSDDVIVRANAAFERAARRKLVGATLASVVVASSLDALLSAAASGAQAPTLVHFRDASDAPFTLRCFVERRSGGFLVVGEPPTEHHSRLEDQLFSINAELTILLRENARQARALAEAHRALKDNHWHLAKIADVLPMCLQCRKVRAGEDGRSWESVEAFLQRSSSFLSHGYCVACEKQLDLTLDDPAAER